MRLVLIAFLLTACTSTGTVTADKACYLEPDRGAATPTELAQTAWLGLDLAQLQVARCEYDALLRSGADRSIADTILRRTNGPEVTAELASLDTVTRAKVLPSDAVEDDRCGRDDPSHAPGLTCQTSRIRLDRRVTIDVSAVLVGNRWFFADRVHVALATPDEPRTDASDDGKQVLTPLPPACLADDGSIHKAGDYEYLLDRAAVAQLSKNIVAVQRCARAVPHYVDDIYSGVQLFDVLPGSFLRALGLRSADIIVAVDGEALDSPNKALLALDHIQQRDLIVVSILRHERPRTLTWTVR